MLISQFTDVFISSLSVKDRIGTFPCDLRYALLTKAKILRALDEESSKDEIRDIFLKLEEVDPVRKGFYRDWLLTK